MTCSQALQAPDTKDHMIESGTPTKPCKPLPEAWWFVQASVYTNRSELWVLPDGMYGKYVNGPNPVFHHLHGSSWHGDDAKSVLWFVRHPFFLALIGAATGIGGIAWLLISSRHKVLRLWGGHGAQGGRYVPLAQVITLKSS